MLGGLWYVGEAVRAEEVAPADVAALGQQALVVLTSCLTDCVVAGRSSSTKAGADAIALWLGLHGLAHQRAVSAAFPWPDDIWRRVIEPLAHLLPGPRPSRRAQSGAGAETATERERAR